MDEMSSKSKSSKKRKGSKSRNGTLKRAKDGHARSTSQVLTSRFARDDIGSVEEPIVASADPVHFKRTICTISPDNGCYSFTELSTIETGLLDQNTMFLSTADRGKTKDVYGIIIAGEQFVAKKLIDTGNGRGHVPLPEAVRFLSADLVRLKRMEYFSKAFFTRGEREGAELTYFQVSDGFLIKAYANDPSPEPEERPEDLADFVGKSTLVSVYLVEPRRASSAVLKFSGALGMPHRFDRRSATIMAFSHFVLEEAACGYMFADIQGSMDRHNFAQNESALTLFDPMTHTPCGKSGLGDHGSQGFDNFITSHKCTGICTAMNLCSMSDLQATMSNWQDSDASSGSDGSLS
ncbi:Protein kinase-like domain containing protein [Russula decolorans]